MKFGVIIFPGSNCDHDAYWTAEQVLKQEATFLWHESHDLQNCDAIIVPGGFAYGDYLRTGAIAKFSPVMESVRKFADGGGLVIGICNGFQILAEAGLVPGALLHNESRKFICNNIYLKAQTGNSLLTSQVDPDKALKIPIAHGEGNYFINADGLKELNDNEQVLFRYCDAQGNITKAANPNGALDNIAGVCNKNRNVFGMMPHPERAADPLLANEDGVAIFESILSLVKA